MRVQTKDWLKFVSLVGIAFVLGLVFASALDLPRESRASVMELAQAPGTAIRTQSAPPIPAAQPAADLGSAFAAVAEHVRPAVVFIRSERRASTTARRLPRGFEEFFRTPQQQRPPIERGTGSGFLVSQDGYILTNNHVVAEAEKVIVQLFDKREFQAKVVGTDPATDIAVLKIEAGSLPVTSFGNSDSTRIGEWVLAIGNPLGEAFTFTVTAGIVSAKGRGLRGLEQVPNYSIQDFIQTDAAINPGNSGGPLVNVRGQVVGINSAIASETGLYTGYGFAIPINLVRNVMDQLVSTGHVQRAVIGVSIRDATAEDAQAVGLAGNIRGVTVHDFTNDDSPAKRAGIQQGDVIVALDGQSVEYTAQLQQRVGFKKPGEAVEVTVLRNGGERKTYKVRLVAAPAEQLAGRDENGTTPAERARSQPMEVGLGIAVEPLSQEEAAERDIVVVRDAGGGLVVTEVSPDGPAFGKLAPPSPAGTDVILKVDGTPVRSRLDLRAALRRAKSGDIVTLLVYGLSDEPTRRAQRVVRIRMP
jgi:serine protease Do